MIFSSLPIFLPACCQQVQAPVCLSMPACVWERDCACRAASDKKAPCALEKHQVTPRSDQDNNRREAPPCARTRLLSAPLSQTQSFARSCQKSASCGVLLPLLCQRTTSFTPTVRQNRVSIQNHSATSILTITAIIWGFGGKFYLL